MTDDTTKADIDEKIIEEIEGVTQEDPTLTEYQSQGQEQSELEFVREWFPDPDSWKGKTNITADQARQLALIRNMHLAFPELEEHTVEFLDSVANDYEQYLTSIEGEARQQHTSIMQSIFSGASESLEKAQSTLLGAVSQDLVEDDE